MRRTNRYPTSIRLSTTTKRRLQSQADRRGHAMASLIQWIIESWLNQVDPPRKPETSDAAR